MVSLSGTSRPVLLRSASTTRLSAPEHHRYVRVLDWTVARGSWESVHGKTTKACKMLQSGRFVTENNSRIAVNAKIGFGFAAQSTGSGRKRRSHSSRTDWAPPVRWVLDSRHIPGVSKAGIPAPQRPGFRSVLPLPWFARSEMTSGMTARALATSLKPRARSLRRSQRIPFS